jgi:hypothetical protein
MVGLDDVHILIQDTNALLDAFKDVIQEPLALPKSFLCLLTLRDVPTFWD